MKKYILIFSIILTTQIFAHAPKVKIFVEDLKNNSMNVYARLGDDGNFITGTTLKLISLVNKKVLYEKALIKSGLIIKIPQESYLIVLKSKGKKIEKLGIAPKEGFSTIAFEPIKYAFYTTLVLSLIFIFLAFYIAYKRVKKFKQNL